MSIFVAPSALGYCSVTRMGSCSALAPETCLVAGKRVWILFRSFERGSQLAHMLQNNHCSYHSAACVRDYVEARDQGSEPFLHITDKQCTVL